MVLHCSKKRAAMLAPMSSAPLEETNPLGSWHGHLYTVDRRQCVMFCHDATRFVMFPDKAMREVVRTACAHPRRANSECH